MKTHFIEFVRADARIEEPVTKFGGQPVWLSEAQWPLNPQGEPMMFIAQIALDLSGFEGKMAYIFMDDGDDADETWDPNAGSNAVVVQPDGELLASVTTGARVNGPSLVEMVQVEDERMLRPQAREYAVTLREHDDIQSDFNFQNKIGGFPSWFQDDETPGDGWQLLLQLDSARVPFDVNFGDAGVGYAFLSPDGRRGKFLWQCG